MNATPTSIPLGNQQAFTPNVAVRDDGTVAVSYYDFRNNTADGGATTPTDAFVVHCHAATEDCTASSSWDCARLSWGSRLKYASLVTNRSTGTPIARSKRRTASSQSGIPLCFPSCFPDPELT